MSSVTWYVRKASEPGGYLGRMDKAYSPQVGTGALAYIKTLGMARHFCVLEILFRES